MRKRGRLALAGVLVIFLAPTENAVATPAGIQRYYTSLAFGNVCTGELVTGEVRIQVVTIAQGNGTFRQQFSYKGSGTDAEGNTYMLSLTDRVVNTPGFDYREDIRVKVTSKGSAGNSTVISHFDSSTGLTREFKCSAK